MCVCVCVCHVWCENMAYHVFSLCHVLSCRLCWLPSCFLILISYLAPPVLPHYLTFLLPIYSPCPVLVCSFCWYFFESSHFSPFPHLTVKCSKAFVKPQHAQPWGGWATTPEDPTGYHSSPLQIGKRGYSLLTKIGQLKTGKMLPGLMSLDFCWDVNRMRTWIHHALLPLCRLESIYCIAHYLHGRINKDSNEMMIIPM